MGRPFKAALDIGIVRSTKGNKVFAAMKGACDGGLHIPHKTRCFPGAEKDERKWSYDAEAHRHRIYGGHVKAESPEDYDKQFSKWKASAGDLEALYKKLHKDIRANPDAAAKKAGDQKHEREGQFIVTSSGKYAREKRLTREERKERIMQKILNAQGSD